MKKDTKRHGRRFATAAAVATCVVPVTLGPAVSGAAAADCGADAVAAPLIDHVNSAHLETSPVQQVKDLMNVDAYVLAHTVLFESMLAPLLPTVAGTEDPLVAHVDAAHLETSPLQQASDLLDIDDYVLAHTVLVESMLAPAVSGTSCPGGGAAAPAAAAAVPAAPAPPAAPPPAAPGGGHGATVEVAMSGLAFAPAAITVAMGTIVKWTNHEDAPHTVMSKGAGSLKSTNLKKGNSYSYMFMTPGTFKYYCTVHPNMTGSVTVQ